MKAAFTKITLIHFKNGNEPETWNVIQVIQVLHIDRARQPIHLQYTLHGEILESVDEARYIGVSISKDLTWNTHIKEFQ